MKNGVLKEKSNQNMKLLAIHFFRNDFLSFFFRRWKDWRLDTEGWLPSELKKRQVDDPELLTGYMYRADTLTLHQALWDYVAEVLNNVYGQCFDCFPIFFSENFLSFFLVKTLNFYKKIF